MKKLIITIGLLVILFLQPMCAQGINQKKTIAPLFNPVTNCLLRYYYFPNIEAYFDTEKKVYYFRQDGEWQTADEIPNGYCGYSMYNNCSVYITDYDDENICQFINVHKKKYPYIKNNKAKSLTVSTE